MKNYADYVLEQAKRETVVKKEKESFETDGMLMLRARSYKPIAVKKNQDDTITLGVFYRFKDKAGQLVETLGKNAMALTKEEIKELAEFAGLTVS